MQARPFVELIGPLGIVEVAEYVPGVRVGGLQLHGAFEMTRGGIVAKTVSKKK